MAKTFIVDGNSLLFRAYYSTAYTGNLMVNKDNVPTNAIFAFHNLMKKIKAMAQEGDHVFVAFDTDKPTMRKKAFEDYKAQREKIPEELACQIPISRELLDSMSIYHQEMEGYEADDLCGSMARLAHEKKDEVIMISSDRDFLQLLDIGEDVKILLPVKGLSKTEELTKKTLKESSYGLDPDQVTDFKGIAGDPSDNYKGIPGIGEKTAKKLLGQYGHLENILKACHENPENKTNAKILAGEEKALFFKKLATIDTSLPMEDDYEKSKFKPYVKEKLSAFYLKYQLKQFLSHIDKMQDMISYQDGEQISLMDAFLEAEAEQNAAMKNSKVIHRTILPVSALSDVHEEILGITYDSDQSNENVAKLLGFALAGERNIYHLPLEDAKKDKTFLEYLTNEKKKTVYDLKGLDVLLLRNGFPLVKNVDFDLLLATYLINTECGQKVEELFFSYGLELKKDVPLYEQTLSLAIDLRKEVLSKIETNGESKLFYEIELPLSEVLARMEFEGMPMDLKVLKEIDAQYQEKLEVLRKQIFEYVGENFNLNSPKKVEEVLFTTLGLHKNKGEKGSGIDVLNAHMGDHPVVPLIIQYRLYNKLVSSYTTSLPKHSSEDGKIHAIFNQALTATGRLSMSEPNLQNISIRNEEGKAIRKAFFYPDYAYDLLSLDYSQIELRVLAHVGKIESLVEIFRLGEDIHKATAAKVFGVPLEEVTPEMRRRAKAVNFGIVYGISAHGLSEQLSIPNGEAKELIASFLEVFPEIPVFEEKVKAMAKEKGYVETLFHRRRYLKDILSTNRALRQFSERAAVNTVIQGSAADLMKISMIKVDKLLKNYRSKILLQIHDELIFKLDKSEEKELVPLLKKTMENAVQLDVPLKVDGDVAKTWYEVH